MTSRRKKHNRKHRPDPAAALDSLASALNRCDRAGLHPELKHGIAITDAGFVLEIRDKWVVRMLRKPR